MARAPFRFAPWIALLSLTLLAPDCKKGDSVVNPPADAAFAVDLVLRDSTGRETATFAPGEPVGLSLRVRNRTAEARTIRLPSSQRCDFSVEDASGATLWTWSQDKSFLAVITVLRVGPGETVTLEETWTQTDGAGSTVPTGDYVARGWVPVADWSDVKPGELRSDAVRFHVGL